MRVFREAGKRNATISRANVGIMAGISDKYEQAYSTSELVSSTLSFLSFVFLFCTRMTTFASISICARGSTLYAVISPEVKASDVDL